MMGRCPSCNGSDLLRLEAIAELKKQASKYAEFESVVGVYLHNFGSIFSFDFLHLGEPGEVRSSGWNPTTITFIY